MQNMFLVIYAQADGSVYTENLAMSNLLWAFLANKLKNITENQKIISMIKTF